MSAEPVNQPAASSQPSKPHESRPEVIRQSAPVGVESSQGCQNQLPHAGYPVSYPDDESQCSVTDNVMVLQNANQSSEASSLSLSICLRRSHRDHEDPGANASLRRTSHEQRSFAVPTKPEAQHLYSSQATQRQQYLQQSASARTRPGQGSFHLSAGKLCALGVAVAKKFDVSSHGLSFSSMKQDQAPVSDPKTSRPIGKREDIKGSLDKLESAGPKPDITTFRGNIFTLSSDISSSPKGPVCDFAAAPQDNLTRKVSPSPTKPPTGSHNPSRKSPSFKLVRVAPHTQASSPFDDASQHDPITGHSHQSPATQFVRLASETQMSTNLELKSAEHAAQPQSFSNRHEANPSQGLTRSLTESLTQPTGMVPKFISPRVIPASTASDGNSMECPLTSLMGTKRQAKPPSPRSSGLVTNLAQPTLKRTKTSESSFHKASLGQFLGNDTSLHIDNSSGPNQKHSQSSVDSGNRRATIRDDIDENLCDSVSPNPCAGQNPSSSGAAHPPDRSQKELASTLQIKTAATEATRSEGAAKQHTSRSSDFKPSFTGNSAPTPSPSSVTCMQLTNVATLQSPTGRSSGSRNADAVGARGVAVLGELDKDEAIINQLSMNLGDSLGLTFRGLGHFYPHDLSPRTPKVHGLNMLPNSAAASVASAREILHFETYVECENALTLSRGAIADFKEHIRVRSAYQFNQSRQMHSLNLEHSVGGLSQGQEASRRGVTGGPVADSTRAWSTLRTNGSSAGSNPPELPAPPALSLRQAESHPLISARGTLPSDAAVLTGEGANGHVSSSQTGGGHPLLHTGTLAYPQKVVCSSTTTTTLTRTTTAGVYQYSHEGLTQRVVQSSIRIRTEPSVQTSEVKESITGFAAMFDQTTLNGYPKSHVHIELDDADETNSDEGPVVRRPKRTPQDPSSAARAPADGRPIEVSTETQHRGATSVDAQYPLHYKFAPNSSPNHANARPAPNAQLQNYSTSPVELRSGTGFDASRGAMQGSVQYSPQMINSEVTGLTGNPALTLPSGPPALTRVPTRPSYQAFDAGAPNQDREASLHGSLMNRGFTTTYPVGLYSAPKSSPYDVPRPAQRYPVMNQQPQHLGLHSVSNVYPNVVSPQHMLPPSIACMHFEASPQSRFAQTPPLRPPLTPHSTSLMGMRNGFPLDTGNSSTFDALASPSWFGQGTPPLQTPTNIHRISAFQRAGDGVSRGPQPYPGATLGFAPKPAGFGAGDFHEPYSTPSTSQHTGAWVEPTGAIPGIGDPPYHKASTRDETQLQAAVAAFNGWATKPDYLDGPSHLPSGNPATSSHGYAMTRAQYGYYTSLCQVPDSAWSNPALELDYAGNANHGYTIMPPLTGDNIDQDHSGDQVLGLEDLGPQERHTTNKSRRQHTNARRRSATGRFAPRDPEPPHDESGSADLPAYAPATDAETKVMEHHHPVLGANPVDSLTPSINVQLGELNLHTRAGVPNTVGTMGPSHYVYQAPATRSSGTTAGGGSMSSNTSLSVGMHPVEAPPSSSAKRTSTAQSKKPEADPTGPANGSQSQTGAQGDNRPRRRSNFSPEVIAVLKKWLHDHWNEPYPSQEEKAMLAAQTNLTLEQISHWYINTRMRQWRKRVKESGKYNDLIRKGVKVPSLSLLEQKRQSEEAAATSSNNGNTNDSSQWSGASNEGLSSVSVRTGESGRKETGRQSSLRANNGALGGGLSERRGAGEGERTGGRSSRSDSASTSRGSASSRSTATEVPRVPPLGSVTPMPSMSAFSPLRYTYPQSQAENAHILLNGTSGYADDSSRTAAKSGARSKKIDRR